MNDLCIASPIALVALEVFGVRRDACVGSPSYLESPTYFLCGRSYTATIANRKAELHPSPQVAGRNAWDRAPTCALPPWPNGKVRAAQRTPSQSSYKYESGNSCNKSSLRYSQPVVGPAQYMHTL